MDTLDLNIDNYDLQDIVNLFKIPIDFTESDMKRAKQLVLKTHPDKSRMDPKFFLFYAKAYKVLFSVHEFRNKSTKKMVEDEEYVPFTSGENDSGKKKALSLFFQQNKQFQKPAQFNEWFNKEFEKNKMGNEVDEKGYGDWLKSDEDVEPEMNLKSMSAINEQIMKKKQQIRDVVVHKGVTDMYYNGSINVCSLTGEAPEEYSSDVFSGLTYQDLRKAHTESVIPITDEDYKKVQKFHTVNEYVSFRNKQEVNPLSEQQARNYLNQRATLEDTQASKRAYELAKQTELAERKNKEFWKGILQISNGGQG